MVADTGGGVCDGWGGFGLVAWAGATVRLSRGLLRRNRSAGVVALGDGTEAELTDLVVVDTDAQQSDGQFGRGLDVWGGALVRLTRGVVRGSRDIGVRISDPGTEAELDGLAVWNVRSQQPEATGFDGQGLLATGGAHVRVRDGVFRFNRGWAVGAWGPGTHLELRHALIDYTAWAEEYGWGVGLAVVGARLDVEEFRLRSNYWAGMLIARSEGDADGGAGADPVVSAKNGVITENRIGLHLMVEGLDLDSAFTNVDNYDNETDYSFEEIPVPDPAGALGEVLR